MSDANTPPTAEEMEEFRLLVVELRKGVMDVFRGREQGACVAVCFQIIYEQLQDVRLPESSLEFCHQNIIALHDLVHTLQGLRTLQAAVTRQEGEGEPPEDAPASTPAPSGPTLH